MSPIPKFTVSYFPITARGESIRLAAVIGKIPFTNKAVSLADWPHVKNDIPLKQLPTLEIEGEDGSKTTVVQSLAILRYFGKLGGLYPEDPIEALKVDSMIDTVVDMAVIISASMTGAQGMLISDEPWTEEEVAKIRERIVTNEEKGLPFHLGYLENALKSNKSGWLVGDNVTIADLCMYGYTSYLTSGVVDHVPVDLLSKSYPAIFAHGQKINAIPEVVAWCENYPKPYGTFDYTP
jgi:prostaglandin-H2 D-isomerase / glutathione transferase